MDWAKFTEAQSDLETRILSNVALEFSNFYEEWGVTPNMINIDLIEVTTIGEIMSRWLPTNVKTLIEFKTE